MNEPDTSPSPTPATPANDVERFDADLSGHLERELVAFLREAAADIRVAEPGFVSALDALTEFVLRGGKRLRPTFAWWAWRGTGGDPRHARGVLRAAASLELVQACALIHDDLIDSSDSRRGRPTVHIAFAHRHREQGWLGAPDAFGRAAAVLVGDLALAWADDMFGTAALPPERLAAARPAWRAMRTEVLAGQYLDVRTQAVGDGSPETALRVSRLKTAAYTVQRPLHLGAALAGADDEQIAALVHFGADLGVAFQLRDDLLGIFGDPSVTGKPAGDDLREGKRTLLVALGLAQAGPGQARIIANAIGNPELSDSDVDTVRATLTEVGAVTAVERRIEELTDTALAALRKARLVEPAETRLIELITRATQRTY